MSEKAPGLSGWLILDKPLGITSAHALNKIKRLLPRGTKIGHAGTLDPLASGVLPVALGEATKTVQFAMGQRKSYCFEVTWGEERSTDDAEGEATARSDKRPTLAEIEAVLPQFTGKIQQLPPNFSAIKVDGKRAYDLARAGEELELKAREVEVYSLTLDAALAGTATFTLHCSKGTYVRSIARDMGRVMGCFGYVSALRRIKSGKFNELDTISLEKLEELVHKGDLTWLHQVESVLDDIPAWEVTSAEAARLKAGQMVPYPNSELEQTAIAMLQGKAVAICQCLPGMMKPVRVFN